jgi:hypothetical protein
MDPADQQVALVSPVATLSRQEISQAMKIASFLVRGAGAHNLDFFFELKMKRDYRVHRVHPLRATTGAQFLRLVLIRWLSPRRATASLYSDSFLIMVGSDSDDSLRLPSGTF